MYNTYANDTVFVVKNQTSVIEILNVFDNFFKISSRKPFKSKCEVARTGFLKVVRHALCGMQCINLNEEIVNTKEIQFSYNKKIQQEKQIKNHVA